MIKMRRKVSTLRPLAGAVAISFLFFATLLPGICASAEAKKRYMKQMARPAVKENIGVGYWIELARNGKLYRCNNKTQFKTGDKIRFHMVPNTDGYAYILLFGSTGSKTVLFPSEQTGKANQLKRGRDYALPTEAMLQFDENPGIENLRLIFSRKPIDVQKFLSHPTSKTMKISADRTGAKDLVPTRMQLAWDDPTPVIMPQELVGRTELAQGQEATTASAKPQTDKLVTAVYDDPNGVLSLEVALQHI